MSHFARVNQGIVTEVLVAEQEFMDSYVDTEPGEWIQTSYNTFGGVHYDRSTNPPTPSSDQSKALRKNYAGIGMIYDKDKDAFYQPQPHASWILNATTCLWEPPVTYPDDGKYYEWDESAYQADNTKGWVES